MKISYQWLRDYIPRLPPPRRVADSLTLHSFEVSELEKRGRDTIFTLDILPNRAPDAMSHKGVAREIAAIMGKRMKADGESLRNIPPLPASKLNLKISAARFVPRYAAFLIEGIRIAPSPKWMQERLRALGVRPINNIVDITNYVMLDLGQPLHAFDYHKIQGGLLHVREAREGEKVATLDGVERELSTGALIIEDGGRIIDLAGIMGGALSAVDERTCSIVLQAAVFDTTHIRDTERAMKHRTEASLRYGYGIDPDGARNALAAAAALLKKYGGKSVRTIGMIDRYPKPRKPIQVYLSIDAASRLLGIPVTEKFARDALARIGCSVVSQRRDMMRVSTPPYRYDLVIPEDLIEEIGRIYGYERIPHTLPVAALIPPEKNDRLRWEEKLQDIMVGNGFIELSQYAFSDKGETERFYPIPFLVSLQNPISQDKFYLRPNLIFGMLDVIARNAQSRKNLYVFETGKVFRRHVGVKPSEQAEETLRFAFAVARSEARHDAQSFYEAKGVLENVFSKLGIADYHFQEEKATSEETPLAFWNPVRSAEIHIRDAEVGFIGEINRTLLEHRKIPFRVAMCDIDFAQLMRFSIEDLQYKPYSRYPSAVRDIALLVDARTRVADVLNVIEPVGGALIRDIDLFDLYAGPEIPDGKKNFAFHIIYQSDTHTLTDEEINQCQIRIIDALEKEGWEVRKAQS